MPIPSTELETRPHPAVPAMGSGPIVVATDGEPSADAALHMAWVLAGHTGADVQVVSILPPISPPGELAAMATVPSHRWRERRDARIATVCEQVRRVLADDCIWPVVVLEGYGGEDIAVFARHHRARMVVMGRGRHGFAHRLAGTEDVLRMLQLGDVPVLAVESSAAVLPKRIVVATDFTPYSTYAARVALAIAAPDATVYLAHARRRDVSMIAVVAQEERTWEEALPGLFAHLSEQLAAPAGMTLEPMSMVGDPGDEIVALANSIGADLVVSATHGRGFFDRLVLGSVAVELLRRAACSFLCVPGSALRSEAEGPAAPCMRRTIPSPQLPDALARFSARNDGRRCTLDLARPGEASAAIASSASFSGVDFDQHDGALTVFLDASSADTPAHTHVVRNVRGVHLASDARRSDRSLVVECDAGTVTLSFLT